MFSYDIAVVGPSKTGKTSLIRGYASKDPNTSNAYLSSKTVPMSGRKVGLGIYDENGPAELHGPLGKSLERRRAVLICFSVYDRKSFEETGEYIKQVILNCPRNAFRILVGTHCDARKGDEECKYAPEAKRTTGGNEEKTREIAYDEAQAFASGCRCDYIETDVENNLNIEKAFDTVLKEMILRFPLAPDKESPPLPFVRHRPQNAKDEKSCSMF